MNTTTAPETVTMLAHQLNVGRAVIRDIIESIPYLETWDFSTRCHLSGHAVDVIRAAVEAEDTTFADSWTEAAPTDTDFGYYYGQHTDMPGTPHMYRKVDRNGEALSLSVPCTVCDQATAEDLEA